MNSRLVKIDYVPDLCTSGRDSSETVHHLFYDCSYSNQFWKAFKIIWFGLSGENVELTFQDILVGKLDKVSLKLQVIAK